MISLANHANDRFESWPGLETIAGEAGLKNGEAAREVLRRLEGKGWVQTVLHGAPDRRIRADRRPNLYRILNDGRVSEVAIHPTHHDPRSHGGSCGHDPRPDRSTTPGAAGGEPSLEPEPSRPRQPVTPDATREPSQDEDEADHDQDPDWPLELDDGVVVDLAARLLTVRNRDLPADPVRNRKRWLAATRKDLRANDELPRAEVIARHPALGCRGDRDAELEVVAHVHRTGDWPSVPPARHRIELAEPSTNVDSGSFERTVPTDSVRAVREQLPGGRR